MLYGDGRRVGSSFLNRFSIGNLGFARALCKDTTFQDGTLELQWQTSQISEIVSFGIIPSDAAVNDAWWPNEETIYCDTSINLQIALDDISEKCLGKSHCSLNTKQFLNMRGPEKCTNGYSQFYVQVYCQHSDKEIDDRDNLNIWFSVQILLTTLIFIFFLFFLQRQTLREYSLWDMQTTTVSDYTLLYNIPEKIFNDFRLKVYNQMKTQSSRKTISSRVLAPKTSRSSNQEEIINRPDNINESLIYSFKLYLKNEFEGILNNIDNENSIPAEIAHIHLNFDNIYLYQMLENRGNVIKAAKDDQLEQIEQDITDYWNENKDALSVPKEAYIIFETEEAMMKARRLNSTKVCGKEQSEYLWKDTNLTLFDTKEPSNIYFENKFKSMTRQIIKFIIVIVVLLAGLFLTCLGIFYFQHRVNRLNRQYPMVDWNVVLEDSTPDMMTNLAMIEFFNYETSDKSDEAILKRNTDNLQCFCDKLVRDIGYLEAYNKEFDVDLFDDHIKGKVWNDYLRSYVFIQLTSIIVPLLIVVFNTWLKKLAISMIRWLRFENKTIEISIIQSAVFVLLFFNSALAILLINSNVPRLNNGGILFNGIYSDFSDDWYDKISQFFVTPMLIEIIFPLTMFAPDYIIQKGLSMLDRNFSNPKDYKTKCKLANDYAELNSGTEHLLFEKYPRLLNIVFVSLFYGFGLPILPILILIWLIVSYILDKLIVMFYHRRPPLYDDTLNKVSIEFLKWATFLYIAIAYWMLTNKQMFGNFLEPLEYQADIEQYEHYAFEIPEPWQQKLVLAVALWILAYCIINLLVTIIKPLVFSSSNEALLEYEGLVPFSKALAHKDFKFWLNEEKMIRERLGYKYLFDSFYDKLKMRNTTSFIKRPSTIKETSIMKRYLTDATNYDLLYQSNYAQRFGYIPAFKRFNKK